VRDRWHAVPIVVYLDPQLAVVSGQPDGAVGGVSVALSVGECLDCEMVSLTLLLSRPVSSA
jgi:hypothetical protein